MTRGPLPKKGLDNAVSVAAARGTIMKFTRNADNPCDFLIKGNDTLILVGVRKARRLGSSREELEREFQETISRLRSFPVSANISRELWTYSRRGIWRLFCIGQDGIIEICQDGTPLKNPFVEVIRTVRGLPKRKKGSALVKTTG